MRKYSSILFLMLMMLNAIGYYPCLFLIKNQLSRNAQEKIEQNIHDIGGNMIIRTPLSLPYAAPSNEYRPASGEITYKGTVYRFLKQRIYKDTLYMVCIRDDHTTEAQSKATAYLKLLSGEDKQQQNGLNDLVTLAKYYYTKVQDFSLYKSSDALKPALAEEAGANYLYDHNKDIFHPPRVTA